jgi:hypothetical protein
VLVRCGGKVAGEGGAGPSPPLPGSAGSSGGGTVTAGNGGPPPDSSSSVTGSAGVGSIDEPNDASSGGDVDSVTPIPPPNAPSCDEVCTRLLQVGCHMENCGPQCERTRSSHADCVQQIDALLECFSSASYYGCQVYNHGVVVAGCDSRRDAAGACIAERKLASDDPGTPTLLPIKSISAQCDGLTPAPPAGTPCSGYGGHGTGGITDTKEPICTDWCDDHRGNLWSSFCVGTSCTCLYNAQPYCTCVTSGPCGDKCCPGI